MMSTLLTSHMLDLLLTMTILLAILRNYVFNLQGTFKQMLYNETTWCSFLAGLQLASILGKPFVMTMMSYAYYSGLKDGPG